MPRSIDEAKAKVQNGSHHFSFEAEASRARTLAMHATLSKDLPFSRAAELWLESKTFAGPRGRFVAKRTLKDYAQYFKVLNVSIGALPLGEIHVGHLKEYQRMRSESAGPNKINQELGVLVRIIKRAGAWTAELEEYYEPLQYEESEIGQALTPHEQERFLDLASSRAEWHLVYWYALLALQTTARGCEMRGLKMGDLDLYGQMLYVRRVSAKNKGSIRSIPLTNEANWAAARIVERAQSLGAREAQHYVFPFRVVRNEFTPLRPMTESGIKKPWNEVRDAAGIKWFRPHDLRHTACTRLAEAGTPLATIRSFAGHMTRRMEEHYIHIGEQAKRQAAEQAFGRKNPASFPVHSFPQKIVRNSS